MVRRVPALVPLRPSSPACGRAPGSIRARSARANLAARSHQMKSVLVTGGSGFIGSALVRRLVSLGERVRVLDDASRGRSERLDGVDVELVRGDVRDADAVARAAKGVDRIWHLAAVNGTEFFYTKPDVVLEVGIKGITNVIDAALRHDVGELLVASSSEVYQTPPRVPTAEDVPL